MSMTMKCRDAGFECDAVVEADTQEDVLQQVSTHARDVHGVEVDQAMAERLRPLISRA